LATKRLAESKAARAALEAEALTNNDGMALVKLGFAYATGGEYDKGISLMEQGVKKDNLKYPDEANLHLGMAYLMAGKKAAGLKTLKTVQGKDGTADLARFWIIYANQK
jgi:tetratricopeptide (TPR) repeat protein